MMDKNPDKQAKPANWGVTNEEKNHHRVALGVADCLLGARPRWLPIRRWRRNWTEKRSPPRRLWTAPRYGCPSAPVCEALDYSVTWTNDGGVVTVFAVREGDRVSVDVTHQIVTQNGHRFDASVLSGGGVRLLSGRAYLDSGLFSSIFPVAALYDTKTARIALSRRYENDMVIVNETISSQQEYLSATVQYPRLTGMTDTEVQAAVNDVLKQKAQKALDTGARNADDMAQAIRDGYTGAVGRCETFFDYAVTYNQSGLLSVIMSDYQYSGGAHGSTVQTAFTFDLATGRLLKLGDLLDDKSNYTAVVNKAIRAEINSRVAADILTEFDFSPFKDIGEDPEFYLSTVGIVFYFQEYAYFPYSAGIQEFVVMYRELEPMLDIAYRFLATAPVLLEPDIQNTLPAGSIGRVTLDGNPTTGYAWHQTNSDGSVLALVSDGYTSSDRPGAVGAGGTYVWNFKGLKAGKAILTFKYYRDWEGEAAAAKTVVFNVTVP